MVLLPAIMRKKHEPKTLQNTTLLHSPTTMPFITACASLLTGIFWVLLGLNPMENSQN
jgi:MFS superfamily sulfate permease-like transporter